MVPRCSPLSSMLHLAIFLVIINALDAWPTSKAKSSQSVDEKDDYRDKFALHDVLADEPSQSFSLFSFLKVGDCTDDKDMRGVCVQCAERWEHYPRKFSRYVYKHCCGKDIKWRNYCCETYVGDPTKGNARLRARC